MEDVIDLPPGFRFHPTDEEIITHYLSHKVVNNTFSARAIGEVDMNKYEPWDLPKKAKMGEKEWYFFCQRDRKYPTGMRTNRATDAGYWKATGKDKEIYKGKNCLVGMKKTLVFYRGRAPKGEKSNWVMHEYRLEGKFSYHNFPRTAKDEWVVCRVFHKSSGIKRSPITDLARMNSFENNMLYSPSSLMPPLQDLPYFNTNNEDKFKMRMLDGNNQLSYSTSMDDYHHQNPINTPPNSIYYPQIPLSSNPPFSFPHEINNSNPSFISSSYGLKRQCKVEQFSSNHSGLSTDINTENSSAVSKQDMGSTRSFEDLEVRPSSSGQVVDLDCLWNY